MGSVRPLEIQLELLIFPVVPFAIYGGYTLISKIVTFLAQKKKTTNNVMLMRHGSISQFGNRSGGGIASNVLQSDTPTSKQIPKRNYY